MSYRLSDMRVCMFTWNQGSAQLSPNHRKREKWRMVLRTNGPQAPNGEVERSSGQRQRRAAAATTAPDGDPAPVHFRFAIFRVGLTNVHMLDGQAIAKRRQKRLNSAN
jgi:hypothetical protein